MPNVHSVNNCTSTPGFAIHGASSALAKIGTTCTFKVNGRYMDVTAQDAPSLALATYLTPALNVGVVGGSPSITGNQLCFGGVAGNLAKNLDFDNGTVAVTTNSCQMYTLCADSAQTEEGTVSLYWLAGDSFPKHRQATENDIVHTPLPTSVEIGFLYIKNETSAVFVPGTTNLDASGITTSFTSNYAQEGK